MPALRHDMPAQELRLHLGEMTAQEERTARAAIRWANIERDREVDSLRREVEELRGLVADYKLRIDFARDHLHAAMKKAPTFSECATCDGTWYGDVAYAERGLADGATGFDAVRQYAERHLSEWAGLADEGGE